MRDPEWLEEDKTFTSKWRKMLEDKDYPITGAVPVLERSHKYIDKLREHLDYMIRHAKCDGLADAFGITDACEILDSVEPPEVK